MKLLNFYYDNSTYRHLDTNMITDRSYFYDKTLKHKKLKKPVKRILHYTEHIL